MLYMLIIDNVLLPLITIIIYYCVCTVKANAGGTMLVDTVENYASVDYKWHCY